MKYKILDEYIEHEGHKLKRIQAITDFGDVKSGEKGGYIATTKNLSQRGNCWVYDTSKAVEGATITKDAQIKNNSIVQDYTVITDRAVVDHSIIKNTATLREDVQVKDNIIGGPRILEGNEVIKGDEGEVSKRIKQLTSYEPVMIDETIPDMGDGTGYDAYSLEKQVEKEEQGEEYKEYNVDDYVKEQEETDKQKEETFTEIQQVNVHVPDVPKKQDKRKKKKSKKSYKKPIIWGVVTLAFIIIAWLVITQIILV